MQSEKIKLTLDNLTKVITALTVLDESERTQIVDSLSPLVEAFGTKAENYASRDDRDSPFYDAAECYNEHWDFIATTFEECAKTVSEMPDAGDQEQQAAAGGQQQQQPV